MDKSAVIRNFSRYARLYDRHADVQRSSAEELLRQIRKNGFKKILELGCGTGNYTKLLSEALPEARIIAIDISREMIKVAEEKLKGKNITFLIRDAEKLDLKERFDLITSNAAFQWFEDLEKALKQYRALLRQGAGLSFSIFGPCTFRELNYSIKSVLGNTSLAVDGFISREKLEEIMQGNFEDVKIREVKYQRDFLCLKDLLKKIKYTGTRGNGLDKKIQFRRKALKKTEEVYLKNFKKITANYQVFFCEAKAK